MTRDEKGLKVEIELLESDIKRRGFDRLWDEVREVYPSAEYEIMGAKKMSDGKLIVVTLKKTQGKA